jgi:hypothetical protein
MKGEGKNLRSIRYGPFRIMDKIGTNAFQLDLLSYKHMYSIVNVKILKLCDLRMIMGEVEDVRVPIIDDFELEYLDKL